MTTQPTAHTAGEISPTEDASFHTGDVLTVVSGHFVHDIYTAFIAPLLPVLIEKFSLTLTMAGTLPAFLRLPSLLTPFIGYMADKFSLRLLIVFAPAVAATLISLLGFAPNYAVLSIMLLTAGLNSAIFHASAPPIVARLSGKQMGKGMSFWMAAGELGRTVGPLIAVWAVSAWTLEGYWRIMVLGWAASLILLWRLPSPNAQPGERQNLRAMMPVIRRLFLPLFAFIFLRAFLVTSLSDFLPVFLNRESGADLFSSGALLSLYELAGVVGALFSGTISDRLGRRPILLIATLSSSLLTFVFLQTGSRLTVPLLLLIGFTTLSITPVLLALVQEQMPDHRATANGLFMAISFLSRPATSVLIGLIGDSFGLRSAFMLSVFTPLLAIPAIFWLPESSSQ